MVGEMSDTESEMSKKPDPKKKKKSRKAFEPNLDHFKLKDKFPTQKFSDDGQMFINSIRYKTDWLHSFLIFSMIWAFGVNLRDEYKQEFEEYVKRWC